MNLLSFPYRFGSLPATFSSPSSLSSSPSPIDDGLENRLDEKPDSFLPKERRLSNEEVDFVLLALVLLDTADLPFALEGKS